MARRVQRFRVRYIGRSGTVREIDLAARDLAEAIREAREAQWPPNAAGFRLIDTEGLEVFEQLKFDSRNDDS
jgi:hypothetical protein